MNWFSIQNADDVSSPALLVYPERIEENIRHMVRIAGGVERLRPHIKTHKIPEIIQMQLAQGITRFKTATVAECEMVASCGAPDVLLAYQPVGPNVRRLLELTRRFPGTRFSAVADDASVLEALSAAFSATGATLNLFLDVDCGMHRTGIAPGPAAIELYRRIATAPGLRAAGLHAYDGQIHDPDLSARTQRCEADFAPVLALRNALTAVGLAVPTIVAGGTPTFPVHARRPDVECSPGTCVLWDAGYGKKLPDLEFLPAAVLLTRVVSKPMAGRVCTDLGHKAVAAENPPPRVVFLNLPEANAVTHSEEHLVLETSPAQALQVGDCLYGVPWHVCPTVALHSEVVVVRNGRAEERWQVTARRRTLSI